MTKTYLLGVLHDATQRKTTFRVSQKSKKFVNFIARGIKSLGGNAWTYKEGKTRHVYIVEFSKSFLSNVAISGLKDKVEYIRGYFDAEGGISRHSHVRYYLYFAQKDYLDLKQVRDYLTEMGIICGKIHNPSYKVDSDYWRFYISAKSFVDFAKKIGSWHPVKNHYLRMKI